MAEEGGGWRGGGWGNRKQHYMYRAIVRCGRHDNNKKTDKQQQQQNNKKGKVKKMGDKRQYQCE